MNKCAEKNIKSDFLEHIEHFKKYNAYCCFNIGVSIEEQLLYYPEHIY